MQIQIPPTGYVGRPSSNSAVATKLGSSCKGMLQLLQQAMSHNEVAIAYSYSYSQLAVVFYGIDIDQFY